MGIKGQRREASQSVLVVRGWRIALQIKALRKTRLANFKTGAIVHSATPPSDMVHVRRRVCEEPGKFQCRIVSLDRFGLPPYSLSAVIHRAGRRAPRSSKLRRVSNCGGGCSLGGVGLLSMMAKGTHYPGTNPSARPAKSERRFSPRAKRFGTQRILRMPTTDGSTVRISPCRSQRVVQVNTTNRRRR